MNPSLFIKTVGPTDDRQQNQTDKITLYNTGEHRFPDAAAFVVLRNLESYMHIIYLGVTYKFSSL